MELGNRRVLVIGLGRSGEAAAKFLVARGARVTVTDTKTEAELGERAAGLRALGVELRLGREDPEVTAGQDLIVVSPGVPAESGLLVEARRRGIETAGEVELAGQFLKGRVIGITGANGKTTTTALIGHLLREAGLPAQVGGNIGLPYPPMTAMVETSTEQTWNVVELSSFQLESIRTFRVGIAVALNVTPDHLDRHGTFERYAAAKGRLFETQQSGDFAVLNAEDPVCAGYARLSRGQAVWFSRTRTLEPGTAVEGGQVVFAQPGRRIRLLDVAAIPIRGAHNLENTLAAAAAAFLAGVEPEAIGRGVESFRAVEHRLEFVRRRRGVDYYNDSKATNVDAAVKALEAFGGGVWIILGGKDKGSDYSGLREALARKARGALLIGATAEKIAAHVRGAVALLEAGALERAVTMAAERAEPGDTVLLAPACASFDQFENYEHRGRRFKELVRALPEPEET